jgi:hypothetical protein
MPITLPEEQFYELTPAGSHTAVCFRVADLGTQAGMYGPKPQILISFELPDEQMADGRPFTISRRYTLSSNRKSALRADIEGWLGRVLTASDFGRFDLSQLLGTTCLIGIKHETREDGRTFANVASVMKRSKAVPERVVPCINEAIALSLADRPFRQHEFEQLPQWVRDAIARSPEYEMATKPQKQISAGTKQRLKAILADSPAPKLEPEVEDLDDSIPFE